MKVYLIVLTGQGDTFIKVVDEETFEWIVSDDLGQPKGEEDASSWEDQLVPASQIEKIKEEEGEYDPLRITIGSYDNDRALAAKPCGDYDTYYSIKEAMKAIKSHGDELEDEYQGYIY